MLDKEERLVMRDMYKLVFGKVRKGEAPLDPEIVSQEYLTMTEGTTGYSVGLIAQELIHG